MLLVQRLLPRVPPRLLAPAVRALGAKRFVDWSFGHYLAIAPPEFAAPAAAEEQAAAPATGAAAGDAPGRATAPTPAAA